MTKIFDILDKLDFFNQRAGRELWQSKPKSVQDKDIQNFSNDINQIRAFIALQQDVIDELEFKLSSMLVAENFYKRHCEMAAPMAKKLAEMVKPSIEKQLSGVKRKENPLFDPYD